MVKAKFKIGDLLLDNQHQSGGNIIKGKYAIGIIQTVSKFTGYSGKDMFRYTVEWSDDEGNDDDYTENEIEKYRDKYVNYSNKLKKQFK